MNVQAEDTARGLYEKFRVTRPGVRENRLYPVPEGAFRYFAIDTTHDRHGLHAVRTLCFLLSYTHGALTTLHHGLFTVERTDGSSAEGGKHHGCRYVVLEPWMPGREGEDHRIALAVYAAHCRAEYPELAHDLDGVLTAAFREVGP